MSPGMSIDVKGLAAFQKQLRDLPDNLQKRALKPGLREIAKQTRDAERKALKAQGVYKTGALHKALSVMTAPDRRTMPVMVLAGIGRRQVQKLSAAKIAKSPGAKQPYYWRFLEFGHKKRGGRGKVRARPYRAPAAIFARRVGPAILRQYLDEFARNFNAAGRIA